MFKKKKKVVYKSPNDEELKNELPLKLIIGIICAICIVLAIFGFLFFPLTNIILPAFYLDKYIWAIILAVILICSGVSLMMITNQGANKKLFYYFLICGLLVIINLLFSHILHFFIVSLFLSAFLLYFAFLTFHELHKTNLTAYYLFIPFCLFAIYNLIIYYFIVMLN